MRIVQALPPNFDAIATVFPHVRGKPVFFAWGDRIFNPAGVVIPDEIKAHEAVHGKRQGHDVAGWWKRYLEDPVFRLAEEIPAHQAEFRHVASLRGADDPLPGFRSRREFHRQAIALRLSSKLYGNLISLSAAKRLLSA